MSSYLYDKYTQFPLLYNCAAKSLISNKPLTYSEQQINDFINNLTELGYIDASNLENITDKDGVVAGKLIKTNNSHLYIKHKNNSRTLLYGIASELYRVATLSDVDELYLNMNITPEKMQEEDADETDRDIFVDDAPSKQEKCKMDADVVNQAYEVFETNKYHILTQMLKGVDTHVIISEVFEKHWKEQNFDQKDIKYNKYHLLDIIRGNLKEKIDNISRTAYKIQVEKAYSLSLIKDLEVSEDNKTNLDLKICRARNQLSYSFMLLFVRCLDTVWDTDKNKTGKIQDFSKIKDDLRKIEADLRDLLLSDDANTSKQHLSKEYLVMILKNILICLTIIGLIALIVQLTYSKVTEGQAYGFFSKTPATIQIEKIKTELESSMELAFSKHH